MAKEKEYEIIFKKNNQNPQTAFSKKLGSGIRYWLFFTDVDFHSYKIAELTGTD